MLLKLNETVVTPKGTVPRGQILDVAEHELSEAETAVLIRRGTAVEHIVPSGDEPPQPEDGEGDGDSGDAQPAPAPTAKRKK